MPREHPDPAPGQVWLISTTMAVFIIRDRQHGNDLRPVWFNSHVATTIPTSPGNNLKAWLKTARYVGTPDWLGVYLRMEEEYGKNT